MPLAYLTPDWPAPAQVRAAFTLRAGGVSAPPFDSLNLAQHVGDHPAAVDENRRRIGGALDLPGEPAWLEQVHGAAVADLDGAARVARADASYTRTTGRVCAVQVADCLPVLLAARRGTVVAAAHCGWRGLAGGVLEATVRALGEPAAELCAWLGPAIGPAAFEVGEEVRTAFVLHEARAAEAFAVNARGRWQCDLFALARQRLAALGVGSVSGGGVCTASDPQRFFSYRRAGRCGRMAALVWLARSRAEET
ncbi:MAG TPA: peptidoglycan editing factor PgeF [Steroidobacteraceae bacterium]|jgi:YfiH family protein|nr:peptidoglycan editing factor PgeF [Steroidobacteraceae bacterium]